MKENEVLYAIYANDTFVKVKQALGIGKMLLSFVNKDTKEHIDIYLDAEEFGALLMQDIGNRVFFKRIAEEKAKGEQYPKAVYTSSYGGYEDKNHECFSRFFTIAPGSKADVILTANLYKATKTDTGAFVPVKNSRPILTIRVPASFNDLKIMNYVWEYLARDYFSNKYSVASMQSEYTPNTDNQECPPNAPEASNQAQNHLGKELPTASPKSSKQGANTSQSTASNLDTISEMATYHLTNTTALLLMKNGYDQCIKAVDETGKEHTIIFHLVVTEKIATWKKFEEALARGKTKFNINAKRVGQLLHFCSFAA